MRASWTITGRTLNLTLSPDAEDALVSPKAPHLQMLTNQANVKLLFDIPDPHPDLLALAALSIASPWTTRRLRVNGPASERMTAAFASAGIELTATGRADARTRGSQVLLSYSGGADSIAAAAVLPPQSPHIHLLRVRHPRVPNRMTHVRNAVVASLVRKAGERGRDVSIVETDLEYLCLPWATFPVWWAISIGAVLLADHYNGGALALGTVLESAYLNNGARWVGGQGVADFHRLHEAAGIPMVRPAAGMSEIATARLSLATDLADLSRSCLLGDYGSPCFSCDKCLRKELAIAAITGRSMPNKLLNNIKQNPKLISKITGPSPLYMQNNVEYTLARLDVSGTPLQEVKERLRPTVEDTEWMERYYGPALQDEVPEWLRPEVGAAISDKLEMMSPDECRKVETWDAAARPLPLANTQDRPTP